jgi:hypothetical protein
LEIGEKTKLLIFEIQYVLKDASMPKKLEKVQKYHQPMKLAIIFRANLFILLL